MSVKNTAKPGTNDIHTVHLFSGEIDSRRQSAVDKLIAEVIDDESATFDLERFDGITASAESIMTAAATLPIMSKKKVVIVERVDRLSADDQTRIAGFIPKLGPQSCLILLAEETSSAKRRSSQKPKEKKDEEEEDAEQKKRRKGLQPELVRSVKAHGKVVSFAKLKAAALSTQIGKALTARGKKVEASALQALTRSLSANPAAIGSELDKLVAYTADSDTVTFKDVDAVVSKSPDDRVFQLIDAIAARRSDHAIRLLNETFAASAKPDDEVRKILALMGRHFRRLYQTKFLRTQGVRRFDSVPEELQSLLMQESSQSPLSGMDWQQRRLREQADAFTLDELRKCLKQVLSCELKVKGLGKGESSPRLNLEMLVLRLSQRKKR